MSELEFTMPAEVAESLIVRPGDTLILRLGADVSIEQFKAFRENCEPMLKEKLPDVKVMWFGGIEQIAVYRPGAPAEGDPT